MWDTFFAGIAPEHVPALIAVLVLPVLIYVVRRLRTPIRPGFTGELSEAVPLLDRWAAGLLGVTAAVHLALPLGHLDGPLLALAFLGSGAAYAWLAMRALEGRQWRPYAAPLLVATLIAYLINAGTGGEEPDQVGIATALVELVVLGFCLVPLRQERRRRRFARFVGSAATVTSAVLVGAVVWIGSFLAHAATDGDVTLATDQASAVGHSGGHEHAHEHAARAQAGVIMRPGAGRHATAAEIKAADALAAATRRAMRRYASLEAARAAGYQLPKPGTGTDVHMENKKFRSDGRVLDPERPETLVFAIGGGKAVLLGVVFVMADAGAPGPEPGGPITRWHAHNICVTAVPPGFGVASPFGSCPALSLNLTTPEMMHVWVVENPAGWFAEGLDETWVRPYLAEHGRPIG